MTSLVSNTMSPTKDGTSSLPRRQSSFARPPLRALYDLLIAPMEGVSAPWDHEASWGRQAALTAQCLCGAFPEHESALTSFSVSVDKTPSSRLADVGLSPSPAPY